MWLNKSEKDVDMDTRQDTSEYKITDGHRVSPSRNDLEEDWQDDGVQEGHRLAEESASQAELRLSPNNGTLLLLYDDDQGRQRQTIPTL